MKSRLLLALLSSLAWLGTVQAADTSVKGAPEPVLRLCINCHGVDGNSESPMIPRLAGQQADYVERQLMAYREQSRTNAAARNYMWGMAHMLSDDEIKQTAAWFARQKPQPAATTHADELVRRGDAAFHNGLPSKDVPACAACHGANGEGGPIAPRVAGQHENYLKVQLKVMATDERPAATAMQGFAKHLDQADIDALSAYLSGLH